MSNYYSPKRRSRVEQHSKQKKKNFILNILIGIVFLLIIIVGASIISNLNDNPSQQTSSTNGNKNSGEDKKEKEDPKNKSEEDTNKADDNNNSNEKDDSESSISNDEEDDTHSNAESNDDESVTTGEIIEEQSDDPNVIKVVKNANWKPVGTTQAGEHISNYQEGSVDRKEMEKALTYATGLNEGDIILWWISHGGTPNKNVVGTITPKDQSQTFRVYLDWVDGEGWLPTKVEQLKVNDKKRN